MVGVWGGVTPGMGRSQWEAQVCHVPCNRVNVATPDSGH